MPINVFAYQHGIYPRSEKVVSATRGLDRGRVDQKGVSEAFEQDLAQFVRVQREARLDFWSDGLLRWQDIFRPLAEASGPNRAGPLVRWFDTNTFFRAPDLSGALHAAARTAIAPADSVPRPRVSSLPSPYMFSRAAQAGSKDRNQLMTELTRQVLKPAVEAMVAAGCTVVHLEEPWLAYFGIQDADWKPLEESLVSLQGTGATVLLHLYFGDAGRFIDRLRRLPVDGIGVDLVETDLTSLGTGWDNKDLLIGCLSGRSSSVESLESTVELARRVADTVRPRNLYLSSNCDLSFLPTTVAENKVRRLGEAAARVKELVSV